MSARSLNIDTLTPDVHRLVHDAIRESKGLLWANVLVGEISSQEYVGFEDPFDANSFFETNLKFDETSESLQDGTCLQCHRHIEEHEKIHCLYEYQDSEPAFYLCPRCESDSLLDFGAEDEDKDK